MSYKEFLKLLKSVYEDNLEKIKNIHDEIEDDNYVHSNNKQITSFVTPFLLMLGNIFGINALTSTILTLIGSKLLDDYMKNSENDEESFDNMKKAYDQKVSLEYLNNYNCILMNNMLSCSDNHHLIVKTKTLFSTFNQKERYNFCDNKEFLEKIKKIIEARNYNLLCSKQNDKIDYRKFGLESLLKTLIFIVLTIIMAQIGLVLPSPLYIIQVLSYYTVTFLKNINDEKCEQKKQNSFLKRLRHDLANNEYLDVDNEKIEALFNETSLVVYARLAKCDYVIEEKKDVNNNSDNINNSLLKEEVVKIKKLKL